MSVNPFKSGRLAFAMPRMRMRQVGATAALVAGGLLALDLVGFVASVYFSAELLSAAEAAGVSELLPK